MMTFRTCFILGSTLFVLYHGQTANAQESPVDSLYKYYQLYRVEEAGYWADKIDYSMLTNSEDDKALCAIAGFIYYYSGKSEKSEVLFDRAFEDYWSGGVEKDSAYVSMNMLYSQTRIDFPEELADILVEMKSLVPQYFDQYDYELAIYHLMFTRYLLETEQYDSAIYHAEKAYELSEWYSQIPNKKEINLTLASLLNTREKRPELVEELMRQNRQSVDTTYQQRLERIGSGNVAATQYFDNLAYVESEKLYLTQLESVEKLMKNRQNKFYMIIAMNLSNIYMRTNRYEEAYALISMAKKFFETSDGFYSELLSAKNSLASYYRGIGQPDKGVAMHNEVLETKLARNMPESSVALSRLNYTASLISSYREDPDPSKLDLADSLITASSKTYINLFDSAYSRNLIAQTYMVSISMLRQDWEKALIENSKLIKAKLGKLGPKHSLYASSMIDQAAILAELDRPAEAVAYYEKGVDALLDYVLDYLPYTKGKSKRDFWQYFDSRVNNYLWMLVNYDSRIEGTAEMVGKFLLDTKSIMYDFHSARLLLENAKDSPELDEWTRLRSRLSSVYAAGAAEVEDTAAIQNLIREVDALEKKLSIYLPPNLVGERKDMVKELRSKLNPDEAYVEFMRLRPPNESDQDSVYYLASVFTNDDVQLHVFSNGNDLEGKHLNRYRDDLLNRRQVHDSYAAYWQPIAKLLEGRSQVYVNPDGVFNLISLHSLKPLRSNRAVTDDYQLTVVGSTRAFLAAGEGPNDAKKAVLMGAGDNPWLPVLYNVDEEINTTGQRLEKANWQVVIKTGAEAIMPSQSDASEVQLWHFAGHAFLENQGYAEGFSDAGFLRSGLYLAPREGVPSGKLLAYDIMNYDLRNTRLVVLSACETGLGVLDNGNGVMNLRTAFSLAGAHSTLMSLWKIDDETTRLFMNAFYEVWLEKGDKVDAFQSAQKAVRDKYPHPYYWGAFVLSEQ